VYSLCSKPICQRTKKILEGCSIALHAITCSQIEASITVIYVVAVNERAASVNSLKFIITHVDDIGLAPARNLFPDNMAGPRHERNTVKRAICAFSNPDDVTIASTFCIVRFSPMCSRSDIELATRIAEIQFDFLAFRVHSNTVHQDCVSDRRVESRMGLIQMRAHILHSARWRTVIVLAPAVGDQWAVNAFALSSCHRRLGSRLLQVE
jgi:hypothetical protein